jgi:hypothetical protein
MAGSHTGYLERGLLFTRLGDGAMTATVQQPAILDGDRRRRPGRTTPAWVRAATVVTVALAVVSGVVASLMVVSRSHAVAAARATAEPLVVDAQTAVVKLSDANTTAAGGFLSGPVMPAAAVSRFGADLAQAASSLTAAAQRAGTDRQVTRYLEQLNSGLPVYAGIIATAEADNRRGEPVGAAYLAEANRFMNVTLLPAASSFYTAEQRRLSHDTNRATDAFPEIVLILLLAVLLGALVYLQVGLARRFRRLLNPGCVVATLAVVILGVSLTLAAASEGTAVARSDRQGTGPLGAFTEARIVAGQARADDELTLVTRDSDPSYQKDYASASAHLTNLISQPPAGWIPSEAGAANAAATRWLLYTQGHEDVRAGDRAGRPSDAVVADRLTSSTEAAGLDVFLASGVNSAVSSFGSSARAANSDLDGLMWASLALMAVAVIGVLAGIRPRLREYR